MYANPTQQEDTSFVELRCPHCQQVLEPPEGIFDRQIVCPACHRAVKLRRIDRMAEGTTPLNSGFTFADFLVAPCNRFAFEMASLVAREPGCKYNPLVIHGGDGSGRTHLMQAIGHHVLATSPEAVRCVTTDSFTRDYIEALQRRGLAEFRRSYRAVEVLLVDDVHYACGKERVSEELDALVRARIASGGQVVVTSDRSPVRMNRVSPPLAACFERGLDVEIGSPDRETCIRILEHKLKRMSVSLPSDIVQFIAEHAERNVRRLVSALVRTLAYASLEGKAPDLPDVKNLLQDYVDVQAEEAAHTEDRQRMATVAA